MRHRGRLHAHGRRVFHISRPQAVRHSEGQNRDVFSEGGRMINPSPKALAAFYGQGPWEGLQIVCVEQTEKLLRELRDATPTDAVAIAKTQERLRFFETDLPKLQKAVEEYVAQKAIAA